MTDDRPNPAVTQCVREARLEIPVEQAERVCRFYLDLIGLAAGVARQHLPGGVLLGPSKKRLLLEFRHDPEVDPVRRRLTFCVVSLESLAARLLGQDWPFSRERGLGCGDERLLLRDPVGHRIEIRQVRPF
jgi:hypothetical protein